MFNSLNINSNFLFNEFLSNGHPLDVIYLDFEFCQQKNIFNIKEPGLLKEKRILYKINHIFIFKCIKFGYVRRKISVTHKKTAVSAFLQDN
jgi:hypothetical protein